MSEHAFVDPRDHADVLPPPAPGLDAGSPPTSPTDEPYPPTRVSGVHAAGLTTGPTRLFAPALFAPPALAALCQTSFAAATTAA